MSGPVQMSEPWHEPGVVQTVVLILGVIFYMTALTVAIVGAAKAAGGNGRPTITNIELDGRQSDLKLRFDVHADGVKTWRTIEVSVAYRPAWSDLHNAPPSISRRGPRPAPPG